MTSDRTVALKDHTLRAAGPSGLVRVEMRPVQDEDGHAVTGLHNVWIWLDNPEQLNSYTTAMVKEVILAFREASADRAAVAVVFTGSGTRAFCTGGNTREYAEYYSGRPQEYRQYMRLFNDMVTSILTCDKPVINRVNGLRVAGGQEIGMACDFSVASDLARFGQAGPRHGSAPDGGSTDFLPLFVGVERAMQSCTLCEMWSAHEALRLGLVSDIAPVCRIDGDWVANPLVITDRTADPHGRPCLGRPKTGDARIAAKKALACAEIDMARLDEAVEKMATRLLMMMPDCLTKTIESVRKHKLTHWDRNRETNRAWLALNMVTEARAGFRAYNEGSRNRREVDFVELRRRIAAGTRWDDGLIESILPAPPHDPEHRPWGRGEAVRGSGGLHHRRRPGHRPRHRRTARR
ncbi:MAG: 6-oxocyclohex-1-ene-1-carbonyl-CoA hydratase [Acidobacteriota bacterium]